MSWTAFPVLPISFFLLVAGCGIDALSAQELETEFLQGSRANWLELRKNAFEDIAISVEERQQWSSVKPDEDQVRTREITTRYKKYTDGEFKYFELSPLTDTNPRSAVPFNRRIVNVHNPEMTFLAYKDPDTKWVLMTAEESPAEYSFAEASIRGAQGNTQADGALGVLTDRLGSDLRLMTSQPIEHFVERYLQLDKDCFQDFSVVHDDDFGRMVTVKLRLATVLEAGRNRRPANAATATVTGELKFLADWNWLPVKVTTSTRFLDDSDKEIGERTRTFEATYDPASVVDAKNKGGDLMPTSVKTKSNALPEKRSVETFYTIRPLTAGEIKAIRESRRLEDFGLQK